MSYVAVLTVCATLFTLTAIVVAVFLVRLLLQARRSAERLEATLVRAGPVLEEAERALREYRELGTRLKITTENADRVLDRVGRTGTSALDAARAVLSTVGPIGRAMSVWNGLRTGAQVISRLMGRTSKGTRPSPASPPPGPANNG